MYFIDYVDIFNAPTLNEEEKKICWNRLVEITEEYNLLYLTNQGVKKDGR